jgi:hypothetical protein
MKSYNPSPYSLLFFNWQNVSSILPFEGLIVVSKSVVTVCCFKEMVPYWVSWVLMAENREMVVSLDFFKKTQHRHRYAYTYEHSP